MRKIVIIIALAISLMSTKCAEKSLNIRIENKLNGGIVFSHTKDNDTLNEILSKGDYFRGQFIRVNKKSDKSGIFNKSDLSFFSKNRAFYTFYFLRVIKFDTIANSYVFEKRYDSVNIDKEKIYVGKEGKNTFVYGNKKIVFKSYR